jgi:plastocyanin
MQRLFSIVVWGAAMALTACGGSSYGGGTSTPVSPTPGGGGSSTVTIAIAGVKGKLSFNPNPATVPSGTTAVFKNNDTVPHRVILDDGTLDTGDIAPGQTSREMQLGGINKSYHCSIHPSMVGSLNSADTPEPPPCTGYCG